MTDPLTKLYNRRYLSERFAEEQARAIRNQHNLVVLMIDIDGFKEVNDRAGHDAGDIVLAELAALIRSALRAEDIVTRYGGEEFCILLPEIPVTDAEHVAERLRSLIAEHKFAAAAIVRRITASIGMALLQPNDAEADLFNRADQAMYRVKHEGGNSLCIADTDGFRFVGEARRSERPAPFPARSSKPIRG